MLHVPCTEVQQKCSEDGSGLGHSNINVIVGDEPLSIDDVVRVSRHKDRTVLSTRDSIRTKVYSSRSYIDEETAKNEPIYGVTSGLGGMSNRMIPLEETKALQNNLLWSLKTGCGDRIPTCEVRAAMLLRSHILMKGCSGIRLSLIERYIDFLNADVTPYVYEHGSIGASGDLVPLSHIAGAVTGLDERFFVDIDGKRVTSIDALAGMNLQPIQLLPKEGLALVNGTSAMTAIAALCVHDAKILLSISMGVHALMVQGLAGSNQSFHPFIHNLKPHKGQKWCATEIMRLIKGSDLIRDELGETLQQRENDLIQDRYSLRCLPQFMGPIVDGILDIEQQVVVEMNSVTDNPLIDTAHQRVYNGGNFLGEYIAVGMDRLRYLLGLLAKHIDCTIALLVAPEFNNGLPPSLCGDSENMSTSGLKGLQIAANSIMPLISFYGNSIADRFPTHAEQFNQNINSMGYTSANLARKSIRALQQYMSIALLIAVQSVDLRTYLKNGHYYAQDVLSEATVPLYKAVTRTVGSKRTSDRPFVFDESSQCFDEYIAALVNDIAAEGLLTKVLQTTYP